jgi:hypothetical protein
MQQLQSNIPDKILDNIVIVFSRVTEEALCQYDLKSLPFEVKKANIFYIDNPIFHLNFASCSATLKNDIVNKWQACMESFDSLVARIQELSIVANNDFKTLRQQRDYVKLVLHQVQCKIKQLQDVQTQLEEAEIMIQHGQIHQEQYKDYTRSREVTEYEFVECSTLSTICSTCTKVCHDNCGLEKINEAGSNQFKNCCAFGGADNCRGCSHGFVVHYHANKTVNAITKTLEDVLQDIKDKYDAAVRDTNLARASFTGFTAAKAGVEKAIDDEIVNLRASCQKIMSIVKGFNLANELYITVQQLKYNFARCSNQRAIERANKTIEAICAIIDGLSAKGMAATGVVTGKADHHSSSSSNAYDFN